MKELNKHEFDEIFRAGLLAPDLNEVDEDWLLMKTRLQKARNRSRVPYYMIFISSVAAVMLLVFSVMFNTQEPAQEQSAVEINGETAAPVIEGPVRAEINTGSVPEESPYETVANITQNPEVYFSGLSSLTEAPESAKGSDIGLPSDRITLPVDNSSSSNLDVQAFNAEVMDSEATIASVSSIGAENSPLLEDVSKAVDIEEDSEKSEPSKSRLSLAINFAPDFNGVEQLQSNKVSYSIGAGLIYNISNKLSIEAGAAYGRKSYQTGFSSFKPASYNLFQVKPNVVSSGFDVMDIQLNLAYTLLKKGRSSFGIGAGISSYLMLDEQYSFTYPNIHARGLSSFHTGYQNNHFLGIANLNFSYKRSLTNNVKLAFNPYLKLPLTDLGYGNIRLRSAGMSVGIITNLNKRKK